MFTYSWLAGQYSNWGTLFFSLPQDLPKPWSEDSRNQSLQKEREEADSSWPNIFQLNILLPPTRDEERV